MPDTPFGMRSARTASTAFVMLIPERAQRLWREGFWLLLGQGAAVVGSVLGVRVLSSVLEPAGYGELALGLTISTLVGQLLFGPLGNGAARFYAPALEEGDTSGYLNSVRHLAALASGLVGICALVIVGGLTALGRPDWAGMAFASFLFGVLAGYDSILNGIQNAARQRTVVALHQGLAAWLRFLLAAGFVLSLSTSSLSAMLGYSVATVLVLASQYWWLLRVIPHRTARAGTEKTWVAQLARFSTPFAVWGLFTWGQVASARWALGYFGTLEEVGLYSALFQLGYYPMLLATTLAIQFVAPILFQRAGDATDPKRSTSAVRLGMRLSIVVLGTTALAVFIALLFHEDFFALLVDSEYREVSYLLPWVILSGGLFAAGQVMSLNHMSRLETRKLMAPKIGTAVIGIAFNVLGAHLYGAAGVVAASLLFSVSYSAWMLVISRHLWERHTPSASK